MNMECQQLRELRTLIVKSQSETLSDSEYSQLDELLQVDGGPEEAAALIDQLCAFSDSGSLDSLPMAKLLTEAFGSKESVAAVANPDLQPFIERPRHSGQPVARQMDPDSNSFRPDRWTKAYWLVGLAASHLLIASLAWSLANPSPRGSRTAGITLEALPPRLVSMTACVWRDVGGSDLTIGQAIRTGKVLDLAEGVAELKIGVGTPGEAIVRIEGPASIYINADGSLEFRRGTLMVKSLGTGSEQVAIETPIGQVLIDGQSSVGLVSQGKLDEVHLFAGRALVNPDRFATTSDALRLESGEAVRFSSRLGEDAEVVMFQASMSSFVSARSSGFDPLNIGKDYVDAVLDSKPSIYWRFEEMVGEFPYHVENQGSYPNMDAAMIGESGWRRYGENRVAELGKTRTSSGFRSTGLWPPKPLTDYTIELWAKPELYHHGELFCMHEGLRQEDGRYSHSMMLESLVQHWHNKLENLRPNRFRFVHRAPASGDVNEGSNLVAAKPYQVRTWQHLVAQKQGDRVSLWIDGRLSKEQADPGLLDKDMQIVIGQLYLTRPERRFVGQIDEVAIYDRCLSPQELRSHIEAAGRTVAEEQ